MGYDKVQAEMDLRRAGGFLPRHGKEHDIWDVHGWKVALPRHKGRDLGKKVRSDVERALRMARRERREE